MARTRRRPPAAEPSANADAREAILKHLILDRQSGLPPYLQIAHEFMCLIETGVLREGDTPPSLRRLVEQLHISLLTPKGRLASAFVWPSSWMKRLLALFKRGSTPCPWSGA
jgi:hypothetical protein